MDEVRMIRYDYNVILKNGVKVNGYVTSENLSGAMSIILNGGSYINIDSGIYFDKNEIAYLHMEKNKYEDYIDIFNNYPGPVNESSNLNSELLSFGKKTNPNIKHIIFKKRK